jgi:hypothetical protein
MPKPPSAPVTFEYLTPNEWLDRNLPKELVHSHQQTMTALYKCGGRINVDPLLHYLDYVDDSYLDETRDAYGHATDAFFADIPQAYEADLRTAASEAALAELNDLKARGYDLFENALDQRRRMRGYEERAMRNFGLHPLGLEYIETRNTKGWGLEDVHLPDGLGQLLLVEDWDVNHPDRGVQFTLRLTSHRRTNIAYWTSPWITEEEIPAVVAEIKTYFTDPDTFMVLYHLHHSQVDF